ncbi:hypothetical protein [Streptomyces sp. NPDC096032]|uniref:hypothetical protein n=1 Tax=Streptomyces sp. NPDC096032 TaxID=3366070 RepID=UPI003818592E
MFRPDRATLRSAGFVVLLTGVFVVVNTQVVYAAGSNGESGDLLAPLNITSSEGVAINGYELNASGGSLVAFKTQALAFALSGLFTLIRLLVGLAGWAVELAFRFPLMKVLTRPAQRVADAYDSVVVDTLGLKGLLLAWAFVFAGFMIVRGRVGRGLGEAFLTLLIAAFAASTFVRPDYLLAADGPLGQGQQVAADVAQQSVNSYNWGGRIASRGPCDGLSGNAELNCLKRWGEGPVAATEVARPIQDSISNALIVKPYMLLQYGRILDPAKPADRKAYAVHLKWVTGGYKAFDGDSSTCEELTGGTKAACEQRKKKKDACSLIKGEARKYCERGTGHAPAGRDELPSLTPGGQLLDASTAIVTDEDREFSAFLQDMKRAGPVGKACAAYAEKPTWWRVGGTALLLLAALFVCGMLLSSALVLLGTQFVCTASAAAGGVTFIAGMLPGPARQSVWKWLSLWGIALLSLVGVCAFVPFFGIAVDATLTDGPDLMIERILLIDVLAIAGAAGHRRLLTSITSFGRRMAMRMRYAKVGGTHLPGDSSELGAALAMNSPAAVGGWGGGLRVFSGGGRFGMLGTRQKLMGALTSLVDGAGMPIDTSGVLADATAEAGRGLAPLAAATAVGSAGARLGVKGAHWLLIGRRPDDDKLARWRKPTADSHPGGGGPADGGLAEDRPGGSSGGGPGRPQGPQDRYRTGDGRIVDRHTGQVLHDQNTDRTLLSTRAHNRLVRLRGYRILRRGARTAYGATVGLPAGVRRAREGGSRYAQDARQQVRVWGNSIREDGQAWADTARHASRALNEARTDDRGGPGPFTRRLLTGTPPAADLHTAPERSAAPSGPAPAEAPARTASPSLRRSSPPAPEVYPPAAAAAPSSSRRATPSTEEEAGWSLPEQSSARLPGGRRARATARDEARERMQELMRRTSPEAERLRRQRARRDEDGDGGAQ